jgi:hypothetical protein
MSYLVLPHGISDFSKVVISLWFRVPQASIDAATASYNAWSNNGGTRSRLAGIVPLITFGSTPTQKGYDLIQMTIGTSPQSAPWSWSDGPEGYPACSGAGWELFGSFPIVPPGPYQVPTYVENDKRTDLDPSYIGVDCTGPYPALSVNLVMPSGNTPTVEGSWSQQTGASTTALGFPKYGGGGICPGAPRLYANPPYGTQYYTVTNPPDGFSSVWTSTNTFGGGFSLLLIRPELFRLLPSARVGDRGGVVFDNDAADQSYGGQKATPDKWHHLLLSFDLTNECVTSGGHTEEITHVDPITHLTIMDSTSGTDANPDTAGSRTSSACKMWVAFDDVNLNGRDLSCYWPNGYGDLNAILPVTGYFTACDATAGTSNRVYDIDGTDATSIAIKPIPSYAFKPAAGDSKPIGVPGSAEFINSILKVEMAEFQMWIGQTIDTGVENNRRAFIDYKRDATGAPIPDKNGNLTLIPVDPAKAENLIGRKPDVELHKSSNWIKGNNTGSTGEGPDGKPISAGQFTPTGVIKRYKPDPSIVVT